MKNYYMTSGCGTGKNQLTSFDNALLHSGIANYNLVKVSSILPANSTESTYIPLQPGGVLHTAYASLSTKQSGATISAAVGVAIPNNTNNIGVIMEYSGFCTKKETVNQIHLMLKESMNNRGYSIKEIKVVASEITVLKNEFSTVFAGLSMW